MKTAFLFCGLFLVTLASAQKKVAATAVIDKTGILIGEQAQLSLKVVIPPKNKVSFVLFDSFPHFEIVTQSGVDTVHINDSTILSANVIITSWDSGTWQIPALKVAGYKTVQTKPVSVTISFSPMDTAQDYHGIKGIMDVAKEKKSTWWWYVVITLLLLGLFLMLFPPRKKERQLVPLAVTNAYEQALKDLAQLQKEPVPDDKLYFTRMIDIFRTYLLQRKGIHSFQKTTGDLAQQLQQLNMDPSVYSRMLDALQLSDFVKFARYTPEQHEREQSLQTITTTIQHIEPLKA